MSPGAFGLPRHVVEAERVQVPFTESDTVTWPGESYWPNHPTRRSPRATGPRTSVTLVTVLPVVTTLPCTNFGMPGTWTAAGDDCPEWLPAPSNASTVYV